MKNKLALILTSLSFLLCGCSNEQSNSKAPSKGVVDCYSVVFGNASYQYSQSTIEVYEYKNIKGECIYTSSRALSSERDDQTGQYIYHDLELRVYYERLGTNYVSYSFSSDVGRVIIEKNYYFDTETRTVIFEKKYQEYTAKEDLTSNGGITANQTGSSFGKKDNKKAYNCANKGTYYSNTSIVMGSGFESFDDRVVTYGCLYAYDSNPAPISYEYYALGADQMVKYIEKWF